MGDITLSSQEIYEKLLNEDGFQNSNPSEIMKTITDYNYKFQEAQADITPEEFFEKLGEVSNYENTNDGSSEESLEFLNINFNEEETEINVIESLDLLANNLFQPKNSKTNFIELDNLLDQMLNKEEEINQITFDNEHQNIFELDQTPSLELIDLYKEDDFTDEEIISYLIGEDSDKRRVGSSLQRTIKVFDLYQSGNLLFKDEASDLSEVIIRKLISYKAIILDFSKVENVTEFFLRGAFEGITKFLTPEDLMSQMDIINISEELYIDIRRDIIPNCYKFWLTNLGENSNHYIQAKLDLIKTIDPDSEIFLKNPKEYDIRHIPFKKLTSKYLKYQREKKLRYPIWYVERVTEEVIEKYDIDESVSKFLDLSLMEMDDEVILQNSLCKNADSYKFVIPDDLFSSLYKFCETILIENCSNYLDQLIVEIEESKLEIEEIKKVLPSKLVSAGGICFQNLFLDDKMLNSLPDIVKLRLQRIEELEFKLLDLEHKYMIKEDILRNVFEEIPFTYYEVKLDKVKLIAYHYLAKYFEQKAIEFKERHIQIRSVRGFKIPLEIFRFDLIKVLCDDKILRRFIFSMKELIEKWIFRYTQSSTLAKYYFDIMMITPDSLTEMLLRSISLTIIKNKNPMTLRAVYSSYVSLIHLMIDSNINMTDLSSKRYGSFASLQREFNKNNEPNKNLFVKKFGTSFPEEMFLKVILYKNFKLLNDNFFMVKRLNLGKFLEIDSLRIFSTKPKEIGLYDWYWYYINFYQFIDKEHVYKIKSKFIKSDKRNSQLKIIEIMTHDILFDKIYDSIGDVNCVSEILGVIAEDISMRTINRGYMDNNFNLIVKSNKDYLNYIHEALISIRDNI